MFNLKYTTGDRVVFKHLGSSQDGRITGLHSTRNSDGTYTNSYIITYKEDGNEVIVNDVAEKDIERAYKII